MNDRKLGVFLWYGYRIPVPERIRQIREAGFETVLHLSLIHISEPTRP